MVSCGLESILSKIRNKSIAPLLAASVSALSCGGAGEVTGASGLKTNLPSNSVPGTPSVFVQMHVWYNRGGCPQDGKWKGWSWKKEDDPCKTITGAPWLRQISSPGYPMIGTYHSPDPEVMRWQVKLAKAAGIDGFFVSVYSWAHPEFRPAFAEMLRVAHEEDFKVGIEGWMPNPEEEIEWKSEVISQIEDFSEASPYSSAFLRINYKPAYWIANPRPWMGVGTDESIEFFDSRTVFWLMTDGGMSADDVLDINQQLTVSEVHQFTNYKSPTSSGWATNIQFGPTLAGLASRGLVPMAHGYPGFDESRIATTADRPNRFIPRDNGQTLRSLLDDSRKHGAKMVFIESFNDWNEYTMIEPGLDTLDQLNLGQEAVFQGDPFKYLMIIAEYKGKEWQTPLPPCSIVDEKRKGYVHCK